MGLAELVAFELAWSGYQTAVAELAMKSSAFQKDIVWLVVKQMVWHRSQPHPPILLVLSARRCRK
jgi:1,6-anhydro-N-acetylmuramate kinase